jgi:single-stranded-DNA-specific exonuclease
MQIPDLVEILLKNRGLTSPVSVSEFLSPSDPLRLPVSAAGWTDTQLSSALKLVDQHLAAGNKIAVYGDYDVDGITSAAILWETLYRFSKSVFPHIPHRRQEGYGLTRAGIDHCLEQGAKLILTADSGITAGEEIAYCRSRGCDVIVIDHHQPPDELPQPNVLLFSTATSAAGLSWFFAREILSARHQDIRIAAELLSFCAVSVICDLVPLLGINRSFAKFGLSALNTTNRPGLLALFVQSGISPGHIGSYEVGFIIGPRLNAMGRLEHALDSLRLLCTTDPARALSLAKTLNDTNVLRQDLTVQSVETAVSSLNKSDIPAVILVSDTKFNEGIIGLVAAKLVEEFYRPALVVSVGEHLSKGSGRSVPGFHLTDFLRHNSDYLQSVGGHEMAAGFSLLTSDLDKFIAQISHSAELVDTSGFVRTERIDAEIPIALVGDKLYQQIKEFAPFGLGNPRPVFLSRHVPIAFPKRIGRDMSHLKFSAAGIDAIYFRAPPDLSLPVTLDRLVYSVDQNTFNGLSRLQLYIKKINGSAS